MKRNGGNNLGTTKRQKQFTTIISDGRKPKIISDGREDKKIWKKI